MNVEYLQSLHGNTCQNTWNDGTLHLYVCIGHKDVEGNEHTRHQHIRDEVYQKADGRSQQQEVWHRVGNSRHEDGDTRGYHDDDGKHEEHSQIVSKRAEDATRLLHLPDGIKRVFHIAHQHQHGIEHE